MTDSIDRLVEKATKPMTFHESELALAFGYVLSGDKYTSRIFLISTQDYLDDLEEFVPYDKLSLDEKKKLVLARLDASPDFKLGCLCSHETHDKASTRKGIIEDSKHGLEFVESTMWLLELTQKMIEKFREE